MLFKLFDFVFVLLAIFIRHIACDSYEHNLIHLAKNNYSSILSQPPEIKAKEQVSPETEAKHEDDEGRP